MDLLASQGLWSVELVSQLCAPSWREQRPLLFLLLRRSEFLPFIRISEKIFRKFEVSIPVSNMIPPFRDKTSRRLLLLHTTMQKEAENSTETLVYLYQSRQKDLWQGASPLLRPATAGW